VAEIEQQTDPNDESTLDAAAYNDMVGRVASYLHGRVRVSGDEVQRQFGARVEAAYPPPPLPAGVAAPLQAHYRGGDADLWFRFLDVDHLDPDERAKALDCLYWSLRCTRQVMLWAWQEQAWVCFNGRFYQTAGAPPPDADLLQWLGAVDMLTTQEDSPSRSLPNAFASGSALIATQHGLMGGTLQAIYKRPTAQTAALESGDWKTWSDGKPYYPMPSRGGKTAATVYMSYGPAMDISPAQADQLWSMARSLDDWTADTLLSCIAQAVDYIDKGRQSPDGLVWITSDMILAYRGLAKKTGKDGYTSGYKPDDRARIARCMECLEHLWVRLSGVEYVEQNGAKNVRKSLPGRYHESRLLAVMQRTVQGSCDGHDLHVAWGFTLGEPLRAFVSGRNRMVARLSVRALQYHETNERWERRLAIYCAIYMRVDAKNGLAFRRRVKTLIDDIGMGDEIDQRNPERTRKRLHKALSRLVADGLIGRWDYAQECDLPPRKWLGEWLDRVIIFHEPADTLASTEHKSITDKAQSRRARAQQLGASKGRAPSA